MDYRVIFCIFLAVLAVQGAPADDIPKTKEEISHGPLILNDEDREALLLATKQATEISHGPLILNDEDREALLLATKQATQINKADPGEETHEILTGLLNSAETAADVLQRVMSNVQDHEEKSHNVIEELQSSDPHTTDVCVRSVFGTPTRTSPVYCGVRFFSQVAIGLYDMTQTMVPLRETLKKLFADLAECKNSNGLAEKFICTSQAYRNCWENSEYVRAKLGQHLTVIRYLAIEISECIRSNHQVQSHLVNKVAECTRANK